MWIGRSPFTSKSLDTLPFSCPLLTCSLRFVPKQPCLWPWGSERLPGDSIPSFTSFYVFLSLLYPLLSHFLLCSSFLPLICSKLFKLFLFTFFLFLLWIFFSSDYPSSARLFCSLLTCWGFGAHQYSICILKDSESFHLPLHHFPLDKVAEADRFLLNTWLGPFALGDSR